MSGAGLGVRRVLRARSGSAGSPGPPRGQRGEVNPRSGEAHGREAGGCQVAPKARLDGPKGDGGACGHAHKARRRLADAQPLRRKSVRLTGPASGARRPAPPAVVGRARSGGNGKGKACCGDKGEARQAERGFILGTGRRWPGASFRRVPPRPGPTRRPSGRRRKGDEAGRLLIRLPEGRAAYNMKEARRVSFPFPPPSCESARK